jgi:hypothetical protein
MTSEESLAYVQSAAMLARLPLKHERALRVAAQLRRTAELAQWLEAFPLAPEDEPAELYCPDRAGLRGV